MATLKQAGWAEATIRHAAGKMFRRSACFILRPPPSFEKDNSVRSIKKLILTGLLLLLLCCPAMAAPPELRIASPKAVHLSAARLAFIDEVVQEGLDRGRMPGCVVLVGRSDGVAFLKAYGFRQLKPEPSPMKPDTVFDLASLTKPIATGTCIMRLIEEGRLQLSDPVAKYIPAFAANGKEQITIEQLLIHQSGLIPDNSIRDYDQGPEEAFDRIYALKPTAEPGTKFMYSDVGFIVLAQIVKQITGKSIHEYSQETTFKPLGMKETGYLPGDDLKQRAAVTEQRDGQWMQGEVHDPRAHRLGGIAGHAGLFSTATDLARYAQMMLRGGEGGVLKHGTIKAMTQPRKTARGLRGLGWDKKSPYSSNRGDLFTPQAFGHGGFTGTGIWIDPGHDLYVIFLSNRVHPDGKGSVNTLIGRIGTIAAAAIE